jgi:T3SS EscN ATPase C-terminal domain/PEGA domain
MDGASVSIDGRKLGRQTQGGRLMIPLEPRDYMIEIQKQGYRVSPERLIAKICRGDQFRTAFRLDPTPATVILTDAQEGATVLIDGSPAGVVRDGSFSTTVSPGAHTVGLAREGFKAASTQSSLKPGETVRLSNTALRLGPLSQAPKQSPQQPPQQTAPGQVYWNQTGEKKLARMIPHLFGPNGLVLPNPFHSAHFESDFIKQSFTPVNTALGSQMPLFPSRRLAPASSTTSTPQRAFISGRPKASARCSRSAPRPLADVGFTSGSPISTSALTRWMASSSTRSPAFCSMNRKPARLTRRTIGVLQSVSRVMSAVSDPDHRQAAARIREVLATYEKQKDLILIGAYEKGSDARVDYALRMIDKVNAFLRQETHTQAAFPETVASLKQMFT